MAQEKVYSIKINGVDTAINNINDLEEGISTLESQLKTADIGSQEFKELSKQVASSRGKLKDFELQIEGLDKEQRATALVDAFTGLTGAVGAVSAGFIAFGASSEAIEDAERKLLGVIGVVSGLRDASNGIVATQKLLANSNINLGKSFKLAFASGVRGATALKGALIATGIGALVVAVGLLIANWEKFIGVLGLGASAGQANLDIAKEQTNQAQLALEATEASTDVLKRQGKTDKEILAIKIAQTDEVINGLEAQLVAQEEIKKEQIATAERNQTILSGILNFLTAPLRLLLMGVDKLGKAFGKDFGLNQAVLDLNDSISQSIFSGDTTELDEGTAEIEKTLLTLKNKRAQYNNQIDDIDEKARTERQAQLDKETANELSALEARAESRRKLAEAQAKDAQDALDVRFANDLLRLQEQQTKELEQEDLTEQAKLAIKEKYANEALILQEQYNDATAENAKALADAETAINEQKAQDEADLRDAKIQLANDGFNAVIALADAFAGEDEKRQKKAFQIAKGAQLAQATMNGILAVQNAFSTANASPLTAIFPAYPYIQAGLAGAFALANLKKIQSTTFESAGSGGGSIGGTSSGGSGGFGAGTMTSGGGFGALGAPSLGEGQTTGGNTGQSQNGQQGGAVKAYVLAGDVVSSVDADRKINQRRTL